MCSSGKEEISAYNDYIANNIDDNHGNYDDSDNTNNKNNYIDNDNKNINNNDDDNIYKNENHGHRRFSHENKNTNMNNKQNMLHSPLLREVEIFRSGELPAMRYNNSHDWEIKMLLLPESPPDTPRF